MELAEWKGRRLLKLCGAEVNAWNESGMKCKGAKRGTNVVPEMQWAGMNALTASTCINQPGMFLFSAQLMGGGVLLWLLYWRYAWTTHRWGVITYRSAFRRLMGQTLRRNEKHTIGNALEKGLGETKWMELAKWKWVFPEAAGCWSVWLEWKCNEVSGVSVRNERSSWNGMERKWKSYTASTWINR